MLGRLIRRLRGSKPRREARRALKEDAPLRVVIGSSNVGPEGWILTNVGDLDITRQESWASFAPAGSIDKLLAEHVFEHLTPAQGRQAAALAFHALKPGGAFRVAVPDGNHPDPHYIERVRVGADGHEVLYTVETLSALFCEAGFDVRPLEYFDPHGQFHFVPWDDEGGRIRRSRRYDPRNTDDKLVYSSVIVDAVRPSAEITETQEKRS